MLGKRKRITQRVFGTEVIYPGLVYHDPGARVYVSDTSDTESVFDLTEYISDFVSRILIRIRRSFRQVGNRRRRLR